VEQMKHQEIVMERYKKTINICIKIRFISCH